MNDETKLSKLNDFQQVLKYTFTVLPIVAGLDKFFNLLANWEIYVPVWMGEILPPETIMVIVGIIEIIAGLIVLAKTKVGSYLVSLWLLAVAVVLVTGGHYLDIALRDVVMAIAAFMLARMTSVLNDDLLYTNSSE